VANEERFLSQQLNGVVSLNGLVGFIESLKRSGGNAERKKIGINDDGYIMEQSGEKNPFEYEGTLLAPQANAQAFIAAYKPPKVLNSFKTTLDDPAELRKAGDMEIIECGWDAAILSNDVLKVTIKLRSKGYGTTTNYN
jgi:hypothetical protein